LQPLADFLKLLQKEEILPEQADRALFTVAPILAALFSLEREAAPEPRTDEERPGKRAARGVRVWPMGDPPGFGGPAR